MNTMRSTRNKTEALIDEVGLPEAGGRLGVAAVLFTYRCSIACRHCLFGCSPDRPDVAMTPRQCADALRLLHETARVIHIAGGEPMLCWGRLAESVRIAAEEGNAPHFVETNCSFAVNDAVVRERFEFLACHGVRGMLASLDLFHQEFVPSERFVRVRRWAYEIFGRKMFWGSGEEDDAVGRYDALAGREDVLRDHVRRDPPVMTGAAPRELAGMMEGFAPDDPDLPQATWRGAPGERGCLDQFRSETIWEFHIDPYGNILTNCGIVLGRIAETTPAEVLRSGPERANRFVEVLSEEGPLGLAGLALREYGFVLPERVVQGCELCYRTRTFLRRFHPEIFGPGEIYGE